MKLISRAILVLALLASLLGSGITVVASQQIQVDRETYDFGSVIAGTFVSHKFIITNTGDLPLTIKNVRTSCGCTVVDLQKKVLAAGESEVLQADLSTPGYHGRIEKRIYVESDDHANALVTLHLTGVVNPAQPYHMSVGDLEYMFYLLVDIRDADAYADAHLMGGLDEWMNVLEDEFILREAE